ncbi:MAG TPA: hypothetical protein VH583_05380 [Vicinamibacterales bacterium]|jgi:hypothetical protein
MLRIAVATLALLVASPEGNLTGEWSVTIAAPRGELEYTMYLTHEGPRLTGYFQSQYGEIPVKGTVSGEEVKLSWTMMDGAKEIASTMTGTIKDDTISGVAKLGTVGEGAFRAERTGS